VRVCERVCVCENEIDGVLSYPGVNCVVGVGGLILVCWEVETCTRIRGRRRRRRRGIQYLVCIGDGK